MRAKRAARRCGRSRRGGGAARTCGLRSRWPAGAGGDAGGGPSEAACGRHVPVISAGALALRLLFDGGAGEFRNYTLWLCSNGRVKRQLQMGERRRRARESARTHPFTVGKGDAMVVAVVGTWPVLVSLLPLPLVVPLQSAVERVNRRGAGRRVAASRQDEPSPAR